MNRRPTELTLNIMSNVWGTLDFLVRTPAGDEEHQARLFREARDYFSIAQKFARNGRSMPEFADADARRTYDQCKRFITMLEGLYAKYELQPGDASNPFTDQDRS